MEHSLSGASGHGAFSRRRSAGLPLKATIIEVCRSLGHDVADHGCHDPSPVDFPHITRAVCADVRAGKPERAILVCGTGAAPRSPRTSCGGIAIQRVAAVMQDRIGPVETRNQARVHMWFADRFGRAYPRLGCADEALGYYASIVHAVGVQLEDDDGPDIAAPFGLQDIFDMVIRPNRAGQRRVPYCQGRACARHLARG